LWYCLMLSSACISAAFSEDVWIHACANLLRVQCAVLSSVRLRSPLLSQTRCCLQFNRRCAACSRALVCALALQHVPARKGREVSASHGRLVAEFIERDGRCSGGLKGYSRVLHVAGEQGMASTWADAPLELRVTILPAASAADPTVLPWDYPSTPSRFSTPSWEYPSTPSRFSTPSPLFSALLTLAVNVHVRICHSASVHLHFCAHAEFRALGHSGTRAKYSPPRTTQTQATGLALRRFAAGSGWSARRCAMRAAACPAAGCDGPAGARGEAQRSAGKACEHRRRRRAVVLVRLEQRRRGGPHRPRTLQACSARTVLWRAHRPLVRSAGEHACGAHRGAE